MLDFTSLTVEEFRLLVEPFETAFQAYMAEWRLDGKQRTAASAVWQRTIVVRKDKQVLHQRQHLEVCIWSYLAQELYTGDLAVRGADAYNNIHDSYCRGRHRAQTAVVILAQEESRRPPRVPCIGGHSRRHSEFQMTARTQLPQLLTRLLTDIVGKLLPEQMMIVQVASALYWQYYVILLY